MVLPRPILTGPASVQARRVDISFRGARGRSGPFATQLSRWTRPIFSRRDSSMRAPIIRRHVQTHPPQRDEPDMRSTPHTSRLQPLPFGPVSSPFRRPKSPLSPGRQALIPLPSSGLAECCFADPLGECRRDANTLAPNGSKARTLRYARQELVRVPESNTKYGGLWGITGGKPAPVGEPSIGESSGIPNRKNLHLVVLRWLHPAVHRAGIFLSRGVASRGLT
jgi:hypothetical protein